MSTEAVARVVLALGLTCIVAATTDAQATGASSSSTAILPAPTGSHGVGVVAHTVTDPRRREIFTLDTSDIRRFPVFVYYPAAKAACTPTAYFPPTLAEVYTAEFRYQAGFDRIVRAHACADAPIAEGNTRFPVILFSHGLGHTNFSYRSIIEDLVSHGNVVVAVDHTHGGRATYFPDGQLVLRDNSRWFSGVDPQRNFQAAMEYPRFWAEDTRLVGKSNHMTFSDFIWLHENVGMGPPPPTDMSGAQGITLTRTAIRLFLPCVFDRSCKELDAMLSEIRGPIPPPMQPKPPAVP